MRRKLFAATVPFAAIVLARCTDAPTATRESLVPAKPSLSAAALTANTRFPITLIEFVPCVGGGGPELVELTGELHDLFHITISNSGRLSLKVHDQPQGISGVGLTTGTKYQATGVTQEMTHQNQVTGFPFNDTFVNNFRLIGQGPGNNFLVHDNLHVTINADGTVTSFHDNFSIECR
jgi:hypothetical protein